MIFDLCKIDWTAIAAIISMVMVVATFLTLIQNRRQIKELKRQWEEQNRPKLCFSIVVIESRLYLQINNIGHSNATDIRLKFNKSFIDSLLGEKIKSVFRSLENRSFILKSNTSKYFLLGYPDTYKMPIIIIGNQEYRYDKILEWYSRAKHQRIEVSGRYNQIYTIEESFAISDFVIDDEFDFPGEQQATLKHIAKGITEKYSKPKYDSIQKSLSIIAKTLSKLGDNQ